MKKKGPKGPRVYNADRHCGVKKRSEPGRGNPCTRGKGERTDHPGIGPCWIHGGRGGNRERLTHGLTSKLYTNSPKMRETIERVRRETKDPMDLTPELELLRGLTADFTERHEALKKALIDWDLSFSPGIERLVSGGSPEEMVGAIEQIRKSMQSRPRQIIDVESAAKLGAEVGRMVERIHKIKQTSAVTWEAVQIMLEQMGMVLLKHMKDPSVIQAIQRDWGEINVPITPVR